jgi:hypothetical protein
MYSEVDAGPPRSFREKNGRRIAGRVLHVDEVRLGQRFPLEVRVAIDAADAFVFRDPQLVDEVVLGRHADPLGEHAH